MLIASSCRVEVGRLQGEGLKLLTKRRQIADVHRRHAHQRAQLAQSGILLVARFDLLGSRQLIARLGFENIGARALALLEHVFVLLELLFVGLLLRTGDVDLIWANKALV